MHRRLRAGLTALATTAAILATPSAALAHASVTPNAVEPGSETEFSIRALVERPEANGLNGRFDIHVPAVFEVTGCSHLHWDCSIDTETYGVLGTVVTWEPSATALPIDVQGFTFTAIAPEQPGLWMFRILQQHSDGWTDPWVYDEDPYVAPRVSVGGAEEVLNPEGSPLDPPCFGPTAKPDGSDDHDGSARDEGCVIPADLSAGQPVSAAPDGGAEEPASAPATEIQAEPAAQQETLPESGTNAALAALVAMLMIAVGHRMVQRESWELR